MRYFLILFMLGTGLFAEVKIVTTDDGVKVGHKAEYAAGNIHFYPKPDSDFKHLIGIQKIKAIIQDETDSSKFLRQAFLKGKFLAIASDTGYTLFKKNFHTGWGKKSAFYLAISYIKMGKFEDASKVIKEGKAQIAGENEAEDRLLLDVASLYVEFGKNKKQFKLASFKRVKTPESSLGKLYYYQLEGDLLTRDEKVSIAVLSYYKGIFLGIKSTERKVVLAKIEKIYKSQNDPRKLSGLNNL